MTHVKVAATSGHTNPDDKQLTFRLKYATLYIGLGATVVITVLMILFVKADIRDYVAIFTGGVVCTALFYNAMNLKFSHDAARIKLEFDDNRLAHDKKIMAINICGEFHKPEMAKLAVQAKSLIKQFEGKKQDELVSFVESDVDARTGIISVLNFFEKIALSIKFDVADENILRDFYKGVFAWYWHKLYPFIMHRRRESNNNGVFVEFENMISRWSEGGK